MCLCFGLISVRTDCIKSSLFELLVFILFITIIFPTKISLIKVELGIVNRILLAPLIFAIIAALCLLVGALLLYRFLVWTHIGLICPATVASVALFGLLLHNSWDKLDTVDMITGVLLIFCAIVLVLDALNSSIQFLLKIGVEEEARLARRERNLSRARAL